MKKPLMNQYALSLSLLLLLACQGLAQQAGELQFQVFPPLGRSVAKVGETVLQRPSPLRLPPGTYDVTLWARDYAPKEFTVTVFADSVTTVKERLELCPELLDFRTDLQEHNRKMIVHKFVPYAGTALFGITAGLLYRQTKDRHDRALETGRELQQANNHAELAEAKRVFHLRKEKADRSERAFYVLSGLTVAGGVAAWLGHRRSRAFERPVYQAPAPPFQVTTLGVSLNQHGRPQFGLALNF